MSTGAKQIPFPDPDDTAPAPDLTAEVLLPAEAAAFLRLGDRKFEELASRLPGSRLGHRTVRYSRRLLLLWLESQADVTWLDHVPDALKARSG